MSDPHERSMFVLLCFLIGVLVFHPLLGGQEFESRGLNLLTSAGLVLIVWTLRRERWALAIGIGLGLPCLGLNLLALWQTPGRIQDLLGHALLATFYGFTAAVFLKHILFSHGLRVKRATLYESACVYLLLCFGGLCTVSWSTSRRVPFISILLWLIAIWTGRTFFITALSPSRLWVTATSFRWPRWPGR